LSRDDFRFHHVIGKGGFGKVWKVEKNDTKVIYAIKEMSKVRILHKRSIHSVNNERMFLGQFNHSFLVNMHYAFQDTESLYLCLDFLSGGDLRYHMNKRRFYTEEESSTSLAHLRVHNSLCTGRIRIFAYERCTSPRYKTRELSIG